MPLSRVLLVAVLAAALLVASVDAGAGPPSEAVRESLTAVNRLLDDPELRERPTELLAAIRTVVDGSFDFREAAQRALGREWWARTPTERNEFVALFADVLGRSVVARIASRASVRGSIPIQYLSESVDGDTATILTTIRSREGNELPVEYRMIARGQRWAVCDVAVDGISTVENYRAQFSRILRQSSYGELVALVKVRASEAPSARIVGADVATAPLTDRAPRIESEPPAASLSPADAAPEKPSVSVLAESEAAMPSPEAKLAVILKAYWIQVGAFRNPDAAGELAARLLEQDLPVAIDSVARTWNHRELVLSRVRVGPLADRAELVPKLQFLQKGGYRPFVAREPD
jgi:phospholipid transport system substrate-binding protein